MKINNFHIDLHFYTKKTACLHILVFVAITIDFDRIYKKLVPPCRMGHSFYYENWMEFFLKNSIL